MKKLYYMIIALSAFCTSLTMAQDWVDIGAACYAKNPQGECIRWGIIHKGCIGGPDGCKNVLAFGKETRIQNCGVGATCKTEIRVEPNPMPKEHDVPIKAPCFQKNEQGRCIKWGILLRGCKAPQDGKCKVDVNFNGDKASCTAHNGGTCSAWLPVK